MVCDPRAAERPARVAAPVPLDDDPFPVYTSPEVARTGTPAEARAAANAWRDAVTAWGERHPERAFRRWSP